MFYVIYDIFMNFFKYFIFAKSSIKYYKQYG